jgi:hypothetical protein
MVACWLVEQRDRKIFVHEKRETMEVALFPAPLSKPVHNRPAPLRFSRARPLSCPIIILSGLSLSSMVYGQLGDRPAKDPLSDKQWEDARARRGLLNETDRKRCVAAPDDDVSLIRLYSLSDNNRDFVLSKCGACAPQIVCHVAFGRGVVTRNPHSLSSARSIASPILSHPTSSSPLHLYVPASCPGDLLRGAPSGSDFGPAGGIVIHFAARPWDSWLR